MTYSTLRLMMLALALTLGVATSACSEETPPPPCAEDEADWVECRGPRRCCIRHADIDLNNDGVIDRQTDTYYDARGRHIRTRYDRDLDGVPDRCSGRGCP